MSKLEFKINKCMAKKMKNTFIVWNSYRHNIIVYSADGLTAYTIINNYNQNDFIDYLSD